MESKHFDNCETGECSSCCSQSGLRIPVTLFDLWRNWVWENEVQENNARFSRVTNKRIDANALFPVPVFGTFGREEGITYGFVSKVPCYNLNRERNSCRTHSQAQYLCCEGAPDEFLVSLDDSKASISQADRDYFLSLRCLQGYAPSKVRIGQIEEIQNAMGRETYLGWRILTANQPISGSRSRIARELIRRLKVFDEVRFMGKLWENIEANLEQIMGTYCDLLDVSQEIRQLYMSPETWRRVTKRNQRQQN